MVERNNKMKMGRPKIPVEDRKSTITGVRLKSSERRLLEKAAQIRAKDLSKWVRRVLVTTAERQIRRTVRRST